ncbi:MAG: hypothetical protein ACFBSE_00720 [Prochloraceae cyanobacterium]
MAGLKYDRYSEIYRNWEAAAISFWQELRSGRADGKSRYSLQQVRPTYSSQQQLFWEELAKQRKQF